MIVFRPADCPRTGDMLCKVLKTGYGSFAIMSLTRHAAVAIAALATFGATAPGDGQAQPAASVLTCTNPASGATWQISIDLSPRHVEFQSARFSADEISWQTPRMAAITGWISFRRTDRIVASSTGGYFLHDHAGCRSDPRRPFQ